MRDVSIPIPDGRFNAWHRAPAAGSPTVVLVHGLTGTCRWWIPVISHLPADFGLIALDVRGRGRSWESPGPFDLGTIADDVVRCLDIFGVGTATVAGYSMGAWAASLVARRHPGRAERLILVDGGLPVEFDAALTPNEILDQIVGPAVGRLSVEFETFESYLDFWRGHPALAGRWSRALDDVFAYEVQRVGATWRVRANREAIVRSGSDFALDAETSRSGIETEVPTKVLVVDHGIMDQPGGFTSAATAEAAAASNPNIVVTSLSDLNHYTLMLGDGAALVAGAIAH